MKTGLTGEPVLFTVFDHTDDATKAQAAMLAEALGVADVYAAQEKASGFMVLVDADTKQPVGKLTRDMSEDAIKAEINNAIKG